MLSRGDKNQQIFFTVIEKNEKTRLIQRALKGSVVVIKVHGTNLVILFTFLQSNLLKIFRNI